MEMSNVATTRKKNTAQEEREEYVQNTLESLKEKHAVSHVQ